MAFDQIKAQAQMDEVGRLITETAQAKQRLLRYRDQLNQAWSADEVTYFNRTADDLSDGLARLERSLSALKADIKRAADDIRAEELQREAALREAAQREAAAQAQQQEEARRQAEQAAALQEQAQREAAIQEAKEWELSVWNAFKGIFFGRTNEKDD